MASRASLNKVLLIGNLTRDPELRYTPQGNAVCSFGLATNRSWVPADGGERREETEFHRIVAWNKLAELCAQLLTKGRKVYVEGRLQTRQWQTPDGQQRQVTEVVIEDMRILDSKRVGGELEDLPESEVVGQPIDGGVPEEEMVNETAAAQPEAATPSEAETEESLAGKSKETKKAKASSKKEKEEKAEEGSADDDILSDLPF